MGYRITNKNYKQALAKGWFADAESINLRFNTDITSLPNNTKVSGYLDLEGCTSLTTLPDNLSVGRYLDLCDCTSLTSLPDNLKVKGEILLRNTPFINGFVKKTDRVWFTLNEEKVVGMKTKQGNIFNDSYTEYTIEFKSDADEAEFIMKNIN